MNEKTYFNSFDHNESIRYLGIYINLELNWKGQFEKTKNNLTSCLKQIRSRFCEHDICFNNKHLANQTHYIAECCDPKIILERDKLTNSIKKVLYNDEYVKTINNNNVLNENIEKLSKYFIGENNIIWSKYNNIDNLQFKEEEIRNFDNQPHYENNQEKRLKKINEQNSEFNKLIEEIRTDKDKAELIKDNPIFIKNNNINIINDKTKNNNKTNKEQITYY
jgi:hypothetical protein